MAQPTNTFDTYDSVGEREDLSDVIYNISPTDTPFLSSAAKTKSTAVLHEWQTDALAAPADSRIAEGVDYADAGTSASSNEFPAGFTTVGGNRTRLSNVCQINGKVITVSGTRRAIDQAEPGFSPLQPDYEKWWCHKAKLPCCVWILALWCH